MTIDECKKYLPNRWAEIIQQDPLLMEIFEEHDYDLEEEAVPPFLFQEMYALSDFLIMVFVMVSEAVT